MVKKLRPGYRRGPASIRETAKVVDPGAIQHGEVVEVERTGPEAGDWLAEIAALPRHLISMAETLESSAAKTACWAVYGGIQIIKRPSVFQV